VNKLWKLRDKQPFTQLVRVGTRRIAECPGALSRCTRSGVQFAGDRFSTNITWLQVSLHWNIRFRRFHEGSGGLRPAAHHRVADANSDQLR